MVHGKALREDTGAATAETAIVMVAVSTLLVLLLGVGMMFVQQAQLGEGARTVAREVMRGEDPAAAVVAGQNVTGPDATFTISRAGDYVKVTGTRTARIGGPLLSHSFQLRATAQARLEPYLVGEP